MTRTACLGITANNKTTTSVKTVSVIMQMPARESSQYSKSTAGHLRAVTPSVLGRRWSIPLKCFLTDCQTVKLFSSISTGEHNRRKSLSPLKSGGAVARIVGREMGYLLKEGWGEELPALMNFDLWGNLACAFLLDCTVAFSTHQTSGPDDTEE